jgi:transcriptional regulator with XRE-family HTH domain
MTQRELAQAVNLSQRLVSSLETSDRTGSIGTWQKIAAVLGVSVGYLTGETELKDPEARGRHAILQDELVSPGLRQLAKDEALISVLDVTDREWRALHSLEAPGVLSKQAYLALLHSLRSYVKSA